MCKAPIKSSPPTNQHPVFYRSDILPVAQLTALSKCWRKIRHFFLVSENFMECFHRFSSYLANREGWVFAKPIRWLLFRTLLTGELDDCVLCLQTETKWFIVYCEAFILVFRQTVNENCRPVCVRVGGDGMRREAAGQCICGVCSRILSSTGDCTVRCQCRHVRSPASFNLKCCSL